MRAVLLAGARTPFAKAGSDLRRVSAVQLGVAAVREAVARSGLRPSDVDAVILGNVGSPADASNVARVIAVTAGLPDHVPAHTVNRNCASGMEAIAQAAQLVAAGQARVVVAGGVESMSNVPFLATEEYKEILTRASRAKGLGARLAAWSRLRPRHLVPIPGLLAGLTDPLCGLSMGQTAEVLALEFGVTRQQQDTLALESHRRAVAAAGRLQEEMTPLFLPPDGARALHEDVGPRPQQTMEALAKLKPVFDRARGTVTAGNASPITDGAAAVVVVSEDVAAAGTAAPLAAVRSCAAVGLPARRMGLGPAYATPRALAQAGLTLSEIGLVEINEAFAAQVLACAQAMASPAFARDALGLSAPVGELDPARTNVNGGAIALGHPVGASGARLALTLSMEMRRRQVPFGLATLCVGGGQGMAMVLEAP
jgi:acetyl-CoA acyltransferase